MTDNLPIPTERILEHLRKLHAAIRDAVTDACEKQSIEQMAGVAADDEGDTIYAIDKVSEELIVEMLEQGLAKEAPLVLVAEGIAGGKITLPAGTAEADAKLRVIVDPIDGTRGIMYQKRSAWILTGVAPEQGDATSLQDIAVALQTEIPLVKQHLGDQLWAVRGRGAEAARWNRLIGETVPLALRPSQSPTVVHGCAGLARFFPGARDVLAAIDDEVMAAAAGAVPPGKALCFEDQYASTGGQLYELMTGHDRFMADLRPLMRPLLTDRGMATGLCCHPYDLATVLIAEEAGVVVTDERAGPLNPPLNVDADVSWCGYCNARVRQGVEPALQTALRSRGLLE